MTSASEATTPKASRVRLPRPILFYLALLVAVIALPILGFAGALIVRQNDAQLAVVETFTEATARAAMQSIEREVSGMITTLRVLMASPTFLNRSYDAFHERSRIALQGTSANLIVVDPAMQQLLNTRVSYGTPLPMTSDPETTERAFGSPDTLVSPIFFGQTAEDWVFNVVRRFPDDGTLEGAAILTSSASSLRNILIGRELPQGWDIALLDGRNQVIATSVEDVGTGTMLPETLTYAVANAGWAEVEVDGDAFKVVTQRSLLTGWMVVAWAPDGVVEGPIRSSLAMLVLGGGLILLIASGGAFIIARLIARSVSGLARDARRLGDGQAVPTHLYPVAELNEVSEAMHEAGERRRAAEAEAELLMREVAHRSKNQLSVIGAMAKQTAQGAETVDGFLDSFQTRIMGLARSTDLLLTHGVGGIVLSELIATQIGPFAPQDADRVKTSGPRVGLNVQAAQVLGMALHELSTNAAKYGAFAGSEGSVEIDWTLTHEAMTLSWREHVPGFAPPPEREGFGTVVIRRMVAGTLDAQVERDVHDDGIGWRFVVPRAHVGPDAAPPAAP